MVITRCVSVRSVSTKRGCRGAIVPSLMVSVHRNNYRYDIDSDDEKWLEAYNTGMKKTGKGKATAAAVKTLLPEKFELIFGRIEAMLLRGPVTDAELLAVAGADQEEYRVVFNYAQERIKKLNRLVVTPIIKPDNADGSSSRDA